MNEIKLISILWTQVKKQLLSNEIMLVSFWYGLGLNCMLAVRTVIWAHNTPSEAYNNLSIGFSRNQINSFAFMHCAHIYIVQPH